MLRVNLDSFGYVFTIILFCLFFYSELAFADGSKYGGPLLGIASFPTKDGWVYFHVDVKNIENPPNCMDTSKGYQYIIDTVDDPSKTLLSNLQIAFSDYTGVVIFGTGKCNQYGSEFISTANVLSKAYSTNSSSDTSRLLEGDSAVLLEEKAGKK